MSRFWQIIVAIIAVVVIVIVVTAPQTYDYPPWFVRKAVKYLVTTTLVGVLWAILYRQQLERLRVSLFALFLLVTLEAVLLATARFIAINYGE